MIDFVKEINKCKRELERLNKELAHYSKLKELYYTGELDMYVDYPNWNHPDFRTPLIWVEWKVISIREEMVKTKKKLNQLYSDRERFQLDSGNYSYYDVFGDLFDNIFCGGSIRGTKL